MAISPKEYYEGLLKTAGVADDKRQALLSVLEDETVSKALANDAIAPRLRQDEFSRQMDALKADRTKWESWYSQALTDTQKNAAAVADYEARVRAYEAAYGALDGQPTNGKPVITPVQGDFISKKDFDSELQRRDTQFISLLKDGISLGTRHLHEFKEPLDTDALAKVAVEKGMTLKQAYDEMVGPRRAEMSTAQRKAEIEQAKAEAVRDYASKHHMPTDTQPKEYHAIFDRDTAKMAETKDGRLTTQGERQVRDGFVEAWNTANAGQTSGT